MVGDTAGGAGLGMVWADILLGGLELEGDGVDDVEADESRESKGDDDGDEVYVEAEASTVDVLAVFCFLRGRHDDS